MKYLLNALYQLTLLENERPLTTAEIVFYVYCVETLNSAGHEIPFGVEI